MANILIDLNPKNDKTVEQRWTYRDIDMPPASTSSYGDNRDLDAIRGSLANIFGWRTGQRILDPEFGNVIYTFLYEGKSNIKRGVSKMIGYEPRVSIVDLDVKYTEDRNEVQITLQYNIPSLNLDSVTDLFTIT